MQPLVIHIDSTIEAELVIRLQNSDTVEQGAAFAQLYRLYHRHLYNIALKYLKNPTFAEDALQEVFLKLWTHRQTLDGQQSLKAFLSITMRNHVLNVLRDQKREILHYIEYTLDWSESEEALDETKNWEECKALLEQGVAQLSPQKKRVFQLRTQNGLNNEQVANQMGLSINTVKFQFSQALHFLRTYVRNRTELVLFPTILFLLIG